VRAVQRAEVKMDPSNLFDLAERRLPWLDKQQNLLAQNIANADTPNYQPRSLQPFAAALARAGASAPARTQPGHLAGTQGDPLQPASPTKPSERAPDGNAVALEGELMKVADTETSQELVTNLYTKYLSMFRVALGRSQ
jgi:flagellar basal-body rod protein FlgB